MPLSGRTQRGFAIYDEFKDRYDKDITIVKSSIATEDCVWIQNEVITVDGEAIGNAHLTVDMAKRVIKALQAFVDGEE